MHFSAHTTATSTEICLTKLGCSPSTGWNRMDQSDQTKDFLTGGVQVRLMLWFPSKRAARRSISVLGVRGFMAERTNDLMLCRWRVTERGTVLLLSRILKGNTLFVHIAARCGSLRRLRNVNRDAGAARMRGYIKRAKKMALATLPQAEQIACFLNHYVRVSASPFPIPSGDH